MKSRILITLVVLATGYVTYRMVMRSSLNPNPDRIIGQALDSLNGVLVYYNGMVGHTDGRNLAPDGYNIGMRHQCVEFVKRYYYQHLGHKMPDSYGNAKDFFDKSVPDSGYNAKRDLTQFCNGSRCMPDTGDLLIMDGHAGNEYGHVAIVSWVCDSAIAIIQQNPGPFAAPRDTFRLHQEGGKWYIEHELALGWLRK